MEERSSRVTVRVLIRIKDTSIIKTMFECQYCSRSFTKKSSAASHAHFCKKGPFKPKIQERTVNPYPLGKGRAGTQEKETLRRQRISAGMQFATTCGGHRKGSGRGKKGAYQGFWCDSSWELAWVLYHIHNTKILFTRNWKRYEYEFEGQKRLWVPDFRYTVTGHFVEIKGYLTPQSAAKICQFKHSILVFGEIEMKPIIAWVKNRFGKDYLKMYDALRGGENREGVPALL